MTGARLEGERERLTLCTFGWEATGFPGRVEAETR